MFFTYSQFTDTYGARGLPQGFDESDFARAHGRAVKFAEAYIRKAGIETPLVDDEVIDIVKDSVADIASYFSWSSSANPSEHILERYNQAVDFLTKIATGKVTVKTTASRNRRSGFHTISMYRS